MKCKRRDFMKMAGMGSVAMGLANSNLFGKKGKNTDLSGRDQYGGCTGIPFKATGFFRLEKTDRWWLVTPEGNAYLSFGLNHVSVRQLMQRKFNRAHWVNEFGLSDEASRQDFQAGLEKKLKQDMQAIGFTTLGTHSNTKAFSELFANDVVNARMVDICHYQTPDEADFRDVFSEAFEKHCDARAREVAAPRKDDPRVLGYTLTDCPILTEAESWPHEYNIYGWKRPQVPTWPRVLRNKHENSPGKQAYVNTMRKLYDQNIDSFNATYLTNFKSFDALLSTAGWRPRVELDNQREMRDNAEFLLQVMDRCYSVEVAAIRKHDPNHLIFGDKFQGNRMGLPVPDTHIAMFAKHFDLIFFQKYTVWEDLEPLLDQFRKAGGGKPCYMGDSSINAYKAQMPDPFGPRCDNQDIRAKVFREVFYNSFARPDFVGWDWCGWMDLWVDDPKNLKGHDPRHAGVQDPFGNYDQPIQKEMKAFSEKMYEVAMGQI